MTYGRLIHYLIAITLSILVWKLAVNTIMVVVRGEDKSLIIPAIAIGVLGFAWYHIVKRL